MWYTVFDIIDIYDILINEVLLHVVSYSQEILNLWEFAGYGYQLWFAKLHVGHREKQDRYE